MLLTNENNGQYYILVAIVITSLICLFSIGISGNDFWWHVKAGEWMVTNRSLPSVDVFSWYARENGITWLSHEWLSQILFYVIHSVTGDIGIFAFSLLASFLMAYLIIFRNEQAIRGNIVLATFFLLPMTILFKLMFYGRPHLISYFLLYATLACLYKYRRDEGSRAIYFVPFLSILWGNFHGGSSTLSYILCFIFFVSGLFEFSVGKLQGEKLSKKQLVTYLLIGILSLFALAINPYGIEMLIYPYANMGDSFMQEMIREWAPPDAKQLSELVVFYLPMFIVVISLIITEKKIKLLDLLLFLFFSYMFFRSVRFGVVFYIAVTFFAFDYFIFREARHVQTRLDNLFFSIVLIVLLALNIWGISNLVNTIKNGKLISVALDKKFIELIRHEAPKRLFNAYDFGVTLIYNNIETFVDARADLFSPYNLKDARSLLCLVQTDKSAANVVFDPDAVIARYNFDAFLIQANSSLAVYLKSMPDAYKVIMEDKEAVYIRRIALN